MLYFVIYLLLILHQFFIAARSPLLFEEEDNVTRAQRSHDVHFPGEQLKQKQILSIVKMYDTNST